MRYYKIIEDGYIIRIGTGFDGGEITESEYNEIMSVIQNVPHAEGKGYKLKTDLTWEEFDIEEPVIDDEDEISDDDVLSILMGGEL